ncbi:MAG: hypothetical protein WHT46_07140 [Candidatus Geothermincolales bacterium]
MDYSGRCPDCGVPSFIGRELDWGTDGVIHLRRSPRNRMVLFESNVIDNLFRGIEELIGLPIEHIVIESRRREVRRYMEGVFPAWSRRLMMRLNEGLSGLPLFRTWGHLIRNPIGKAVAGKAFQVGKVYGYGEAGWGPLWEAKDVHPWRVIPVREPYSVLFYAAEILATVEAFEGRDMWVRYEQEGDDTWVFTVYPAEHPVELGGRLRRRRYAFREGDLVLEKCPRCGVPREVGRMTWDLQRGIITDGDTGRRLAIFGPHALDSVISDLEEELGEEIPQVVVEAQRRYVKSRVAQENWRRRGTTFARMAAVRGLGYVADFEVDEKRLRVRILNSCMPYICVGMAKALYELAMGRESSEAHWNLSDDGELEIAVELK